MITILTPTYNRAYILENAYKSLASQTCKNFEWLIIDDGSSDNTEELVAPWLTEDHGFTIKYFKQKNGGKHRAVNKGVQCASYDYVFILDSDDYLTNDAVEKIHKWIDSIKDIPGFAGVSGLRGYSNGKVIGENATGKYVDALNSERNKYSLSGDKAEIYKTEILKKYPFPEFDGENFLRENASWDAIAKDGYKLRWFNEIIYICEYLADGLTKTVDEKVYIKNFQGFTYCSKLQCEVYKFPYRHIRIGYYYKVATIKGKTNKEICEALEISHFSLFIGRIIYGLNSLKNKIRTFVRGLHGKKKNK